MRQQDFDRLQDPALDALHDADRDARHYPADAPDCCTALHELRARIHALAPHDQTTSDDGGHW